MASESSNNAVSKPFLETGLGKLPPEIREMIFIRLVATPPPYAGHDFAVDSAGPKDPASAPNKFVHIKASWHQVTQTCRQIYLEAYPLFFASDSYYLANPHELTGLLDDGLRMIIRERRCVLERYSTAPFFRHDTITTLCLEGLVTENHLYTQEQIENILSDRTDQGSGGSTRQQLEAQTVKQLVARASVRLSRLPNLKTVGLRMRVGQEMEHINFMYGASGMLRGLVEFLDRSHWLIRTQRHNDVWRIQYACFTFADYARDKNAQRIPYDRLCIEEEVTDIDSRAPRLQEGDERYVEVQIQRSNSDDETGTVSGVSDAGTEGLIDTRATSPPESSDLDTAQIGELQEFPETAHNDVEIDLGVPPMDMEDDLQFPPLDHQDVLLPAHNECKIELEVPLIEMEEDLQISPLDNDLSGTELEQEILNASEPFVPSQSQDAYDSQSSEHTDQENDHAPSDTASHDVSSIQSTEPSPQQAEESLLPTYSTFAWHPVPTNTESSRRFQTDSDDEDSNLQNESRLGDQAPQSTQNKEVKAERHRRIRKRLLRQVQQPLLRFSDIPYPDTAEGTGSFNEWQELVDPDNNEQTETGAQESIQLSRSEMREHGIENSGATSQKATSIKKQPLTAFREWFWSLPFLVQIWGIAITFRYLWLLIVFLTASSTDDAWRLKRSNEE